MTGTSKQRRSAILVVIGALVLGNVVSWAGARVGLSSYGGIWAVVVFMVVLVATALLWPQGGNT